jgi:hypothetical protein
MTTCRSSINPAWWNFAGWPCTVTCVPQVQRLSSAKVGDGGQALRAAAAAAAVGAWIVAASCISHSST